MGDHTAFFYGTLMAPAVLYRVIYGTSSPEPWQRALTTVKPAILLNYRRHHVKRADYPAILPNSDLSASVRGSLVTGLTDGDVWRLDVFEGDMYARQKVKVKVLRDTELDEAADESHLEGLEEVEAETYVWIYPRDHLEDGEWDFDAFKRDRMKDWVSVDGIVNDDVDEGFADVDEAAKAKEANDKQNGISHDPTGGRGRGGKITEQLKSAV